MNKVALSAPEAQQLEIGLSQIITAHWTIVTGAKTVFLKTGPRASTH